MLERIKHTIRMFVLRGGNVTCCLCNKKYLTFLPSGDDIKAHARCPGCDSIDRHRQLWLLLEEDIKNAKTPYHILHIAPEKQIGKRLSAMENIEYHAIDKFEKGYQYPANVQQMDITNLTFDNNYFDLVLCSHILEHIGDDKKALNELLRVLKPNAKGYIIVPYFPELQSTFEDPNAQTPEQRLLAYGQQDHVRKYGPDFKIKLASAGFAVEIIFFEEKYTYEEKVKMGLLNAELIFKVTKPS